jgi:lipopolysaccharide transport system permease protein
MIRILGAPFVPAWRHRRLLGRALGSEVRQKYAGSLLGLAWLAVAPLALMALYAVVYLYIFRVRPPDMSGPDYLLYIFSGLIPFLGFTEALAGGTASLSTNRAVLLNTVFPAELIPLRAVLAAQLQTAVGLALVAVAALALGRGGAALLFLPVIWALLVLFTAGLAWLTSLAQLVARDVQQALTFVAMALLTVSPIGYTPEMAPPAVQLLVWANPLSYFVIGFHDAAVYGRLPAPAVLAGMIALALGSVGAGYWVFARAKRAILDHA